MYNNYLYIFRSYLKSVSMCLSRCDSATISTFQKFVSAHSIQSCTAPSWQYFNCCDYGSDTVPNNAKGTHGGSKVPRKS